MNKFEIVLGDAVFMVSIPSRFQNHFNTPINLPHFHIDHEIHIVLEGEAIMELDGVDVPMMAGDIHIIPRNICHYYKSHNEQFNKISLLYTMSKHPDEKKGFSEYAFYSAIFNHIEKCISVHDENIRRLGNDLLSLESSEKNDHIHRTLYAMIFISLAKLVESRFPESVKEITRDENSNKDSRDQKKTIENFFFRRYGENVTIEDLARELYRSVPQTHRIVKNYFNDNFKTILVKQRMEQACMLVKHGDMKFGDIALACGYNSYNGFLSAFKKYTGKTPEGYRGGSHRVAANER